MNKTDFENGFTLGYTIGGIVSPLDHLITFKIDDEYYQKVIVKNGNSIGQPAEPITGGYSSISWQNNGETIKFPFTPTKDTVINALKSSWSDILYKYYNVDKTVYPYIFIEYSCMLENNGIIPTLTDNMMIIFAEQLVKHKSENEDNTYYVEAKNCIHSGKHAATFIIEDEYEQGVNGSTICSFIINHVNSVGYSIDESFVNTGKHNSSVHQFRDYWVTNDTTWADVTPAVKQVFIIT